MHTVSKSGSKPIKFYNDVCEAFISADILLRKLKNEALKSFLAKYTKQKVPDESTIRRN
ncbi:hypothetical protein RI129_011512 [Pyrocoelia pectoralis]|uniref:Uncharacterized protein n=1 Tax=Pyrocoelia pectoralis TaxID=417401 RepID=A0AAN7Z7N5_9COLE